MERELRPVGIPWFKSGFQSSVQEFEAGRHWLLIRFLIVDQEARWNGQKAIKDGIAAGTLHLHPSIGQLNSSLPPKQRRRFIPRKAITPLLDIPWDSPILNWEPTKKDKKSNTKASSAFSHLTFQLHPCFQLSPCLTDWTNPLYKVNWSFSFSRLLFRSSATCSALKRRKSIP